MPTLHISFLSGVNRGLQLICVIAPSAPHTLTHTRVSSLPTLPLHPALSTPAEFNNKVIVVGYRRPDSGSFFWEGECNYVIETHN